MKKHLKAEGWNLKAENNWKRGVKNMLLVVPNG